MRSFVVLSLLLTATSALGSFSLFDKRLGEEWESFKDTYGKKYVLPTEEIRRRFIWLRNRQRINAHNEQADLGLHSYRMAINAFADMTLQEALPKSVRPVWESSKALPDTHSTSLADLPNAVDWNKAGYVTPVTDQGLAGSAVALSVTGSIESVNGIENRKLTPLAYQQIEDCYNDQLIPGAFEYVVKAGGIMSEAAYANSTKTGQCRFDSNDVECRLKSFGAVDKTELALQASVANIGPISIAINADKLLFYKSGIFDDASCGVNSPNHALLVTGYGSENGVDFWSVKNSWGSTWGEEGYIRIKRNTDTCKIADYAYYPVLA